MFPVFRGSLLIFSFLISIYLFLYNSYCGKSVVKRIDSYLLCISFFFPFLDISLSNGVNTLNAISYIYICVNIDVLVKFNWRKYYVILVLVLILLFTSFLSEFYVDSLLSIFPILTGFIIFISVTVLLEYNPFISLYKYLKMPIVYTIIWWLIQLLFPNFTLYRSELTESRLSSCYLEPQVAGCVIAMLSLYKCNSYICKKYLRDLLLAFILFIIGCFTGSKTFFIGFSFGFIYLLIFQKIDVKKILFSIGFFMVILLTQNVWMELPVFQRFETVDDSYNYRSRVFWTKAYEIFENNWFSGIGTGVFQQYLQRYHIPLQHWHGGDIIYATQPESGYLLWLDEIGIFSVIYFVMIIYIIKRRGNKYCNISLFFPWIINFVSVYNLESRQLVFILFIVSAYIVNYSNRKERLHENINCGNC